MPFQFTPEEFQAIQDDFLNAWPIERLKAITLEEYSNRDKTSFTNWLEFKSRWTGSIRGGSSLKFLVYNRSERSDVPPKKSNSRIIQVKTWIST